MLEWMHVDDLASLQGRSSDVVAPEVWGQLLALPDSRGGDGPPALYGSGGVHAERRGRPPGGGLDHPRGRR